VRVNDDLFILKKMGGKIRKSPKKKTPPAEAMGKRKGGKVFVHTRDHTPLMSLSGTRKVVRSH
jgi:hypothetical protein